ncbi:MAG: hypothetical protein ACREQZ_15740 [Woeseiaceae bacterium]
MRRPLVNLAAFAFGLALPLLMAQVGGFPSRPRFQTLLVGIGAAPTQPGEVTFRNDINDAHDLFVDNDSNGTANQARLIASSGDAQVQIQAGGSGRTAVLLTNGTVGAVGVVKTFGAIPLEFGTGGTLAATISSAQVMNFVKTPTIAGTPLLESGTFIASFSAACTTTPTITFDYQRSGNIVTLAIVGTTGFPCTGDSTSFDSVSSQLPASIIPAAGGGTGFGGSVWSGFTDNSAATWGQMSVNSDGSLQFSNCATFGAGCSSLGWTAALNRNVPAQKVMTYMLGNP